MRSNIAVLPQRRENRILKRGDIYYADLCGLEQSLGSEQTGRRPVLIIQNDVGNLHSPTTIVAILTTKIKRNLPTHVVIRGFAGLSQTSAVCLEQIKTIDKSRLENYCGSQADTLMQMGRWFGYRKGYELLPRLWITSKTNDQFKFLAALDQELRDEIHEMDTLGKSPANYGPRVKNTPKASFIRITARKPLRNIYKEVF